MATLAGTLVSNKYSPDREGQFFIEYWQIASGGAAGDTCAITPNRGRFVVAATAGSASTNVSTNGTSTNVTFTLVGGTATQGAQIVRLLVKP